jgi:hypothetical protein
MTRLGTHRGRRMRLAASCVAAVAATALAVAGVAGASGYSDGSHLSSAQDQYGTHQVLKPPHVHHPGAGVQAATVVSTPAAPTVAVDAAATSSPSSTLPFTGFALLKVVLIALALIAAGFLMRRLPARHRDD